MRNLASDLRAEMTRLTTDRADLDRKIFKIGELLAYYDPSAIDPSVPGMDVPIRIIEAEPAQVEPPLQPTVRYYPASGKRRGRRADVYTPERIALIKNGINEFDNATLFKMCNQLPGKRLATVAALTVWLAKRGINRKIAQDEPKWSPKYTPARIALIRELFPHYTSASIWRRVNQLPGTKIKSPEGLQMFASTKLGLTRRLTRETDGAPS